MTEQKREPQPGDLIWADRSVKGLSYNHCGIYEGAGYVIHFAAPEGAEINSENAVVHRTSFEHFTDGCPVKVIDIKDSLTPEETLSRAQTCFGMRGYNFTTFNCDHFATWCKTGEYRSIQVEEAKMLLKNINNPIADIVCDVHDIAESIKAPRLNTVYPVQENEILDTIDINASMTEVIPPVLDEDKENDIHADYMILDDDEADDEGIDADDDSHPAKKPWYERVGDTLKDITYPVSVGLELLKKKFPILRPIPVMYLAAKARNVIDNIVTSIKVFTGRITKEEAYAERMNNEAALAGSIAQQKQTQPIRTVMQHVFGKTGSIVKHIVQKTVNLISSPRVRKAIKTGAQKVGTAIASGFRSMVSKIKSTATKIESKAKAFFGIFKR
jgi:hypothetical protein